MLTVCGLLLSTSFVVLFFILKNTEFDIPIIVPILLLVTPGLLTCSIVCSVLSALMPIPGGVITKIELVDFLTRTYRREHRRIIIGVWFLLIAIMVFVTALSIFTLRLI